MLWKCLNVWQTSKACVETSQWSLSDGTPLMSHGVPISHVNKWIKCMLKWKAKTPWYHSLSLDFVALRLTLSLSSLQQVPPVEVRWCNLFLFSTALPQAQLEVPGSKYWSQGLCGSWTPSSWSVGGVKQMNFCSEWTWWDDVIPFVFFSCPPSSIAGDVWHNRFTEGVIMVRWCNPFALLVVLTPSHLEVSCSNDCWEITIIEVVVVQPLCSF